MTSIDRLRVKVHNSPYRLGPLISTHPKGFTLVELLVVVVIVAILSSLSLAGLTTARARAKYTKTESTIRKIHEIIMPHYEDFIDRNNCPQLQNTPPGTGALRPSDLVRRRRAVATELPDSWLDLVDRYDATLNRFKFNNVSVDRESAVTRSLRTVFEDESVTVENAKNAAPESLYAVVMYGGFADPNIASHFRSDEFSDSNDNNLMEFIDGWGQPIHFLRWAPGFVSRYQPAGDNSHDAFDRATEDPFARKTLFPLVYSVGPDGAPGINARTDDVSGGNVNFSWHRVLYDPWFVTRNDGFLMRGDDVNTAVRIPIAPHYTTEFGADDPSSPAGKNDNLFSHSMSR